MPTQILRSHFNGRDGALRDILERGLWPLALEAAPGDVDEWTAMIREAAGAPERRKRWAQRAREVAEERMSWPEIAESFEVVLGDALEAARVASSEAPEAARPG